MDGLQDEAKLEEQGAQQQASQRDDQDEAAQAAVTAGVQGTSGGDAAKARADYETALAERDARITELEGEIAEAAKTAEGDEERVGFELQLAGARNVKAALALPPDLDNDVEKLKAAEPWLFSAPAIPAPTGATGLPSAGAAGTDESTQMSRWRKIAGLPESEE